MRCFSTMKLPTPNADAVQHSEKVKQYIADKIQQSDGAISFAEYMEYALYSPGLGYYSAGCIKFGEQGDFITAPEISSLFSRCIAQAISPVLQKIPSATILEVGAGSGKMAADILNQLTAMNVHFDQYCILERSAELKQRQQQTIIEIAPQLSKKVQWLDSLPTSFSGVVIANELLDAMPVQRFKKKNQSVVELTVAFKDAQFVWQEVTSSGSRLEARVSKIERSLGVEFLENYQSEINFAAEDWLASINDMLEIGYILLLDYGYSEKEYFHEQRTQGTLNCYYQHRRHDDPFLYPGLQDITAHIDFTNLADAVLNDNLNTSSNIGTDTIPSLQLNGYTTQSQFLMASGLTDFVTQIGGDVKQQLMLNQEIKKLTMPYEMGENVKVIGFEKGLSNDSNFSLPCFSMRDLRYQL